MKTLIMLVMLKIMYDAFNGLNHPVILILSIFVVLLTFSGLPFITLILVTITIFTLFTLNYRNSKRI